MAESLLKGTLLSPWGRPPAAFRNDTFCLRKLLLNCPSKWYSFLLRLQSNMSSWQHLTTKTFAAFLEGVQTPQCLGWDSAGVVTFCWSIFLLWFQLRWGSLLIFHWNWLSNRYIWLPVLLTFIGERSTEKHNEPIAGSKWWQVGRKGHWAELLSPWHLRAGCRSHKALPQSHSKVLCGAPRCVNQPV